MNYDSTGGRFAALVNSARDILWEMDSAGAFTFLSPSVHAISGYTPAELIGRSPHEFMVERDRARVAETLVRHIARREPFELFECTQETKDGRLVDMEVNGDPFFDGAGNLLGYRGVARDVTARNQDRAAQAHLASLVASAYDAIMSKDRDHRIAYWNHGAERIFGYTESDVLGLPVDILAPEHLKDESLRLTNQMLAGAPVRNHRTQRLRKDGKTVEILITYSPILDRAGAVIGTSAIAKDITEQLALEHEVAEQKALLETQLSLSPDGILAVGADGRIKSYNKRFLEMWAVPEQVMRDGSDAEALQSAAALVADPEGFAARVAYLYAHPEEKGFDELAMKDGRIFQRYTAAMIGADGGNHGRLWYFRDITAQRSAEQAAHAELARYGRSMAATVEAVAGIAELRDPYTSGHQRRVSATAVALARKLGMPEYDIEGIRIAGLLHDIGKISIPAEILSKPGRLTNAEFELLKSHPGAGYDILKGVEFPWPVAEMVFQHHERMDGKGYPRGLTAAKILRQAQILAVADVAEAMMSHRPYRPALGAEKAFAELEEGRGTRYAADVVDACIALFREDGFANEPPAAAAPASVAEERRRLPRLKTA